MRIYSERYIWTEESQTHEHVLLIQVQKNFFFLEKNVSTIQQKYYGFMVATKSTRQYASEKIQFTHAKPNKQRSQTFSLFFLKREDTTVEQIPNLYSLYIKRPFVRPPFSSTACRREKYFFFFFGMFLLERQRRQIIQPLFFFQKIKHRVSTTHTR